MARGINAAGDVTQLADGTDTAKLWQDYVAAIKEYNARRSTLVDLVTFKTTRAMDPVLQSFTGSEFEDASEYGQPVGIRPTITHVEMGFPFRWRDLATRFTFQYLADATREQTDGVTNAAMEADSKQMFAETMNALFGNANRVNKEGNTVYPLYNGDAAVPPAYDGVTFASPHTHLVTTNNASLTQTSVDALLELPREHGYGVAGNGRLLLLVNRAQGNVIRGFRSAANGGSGLYDFIPSDGAPARLTSEAVVGETPPAKFGDQALIGAYGPSWVGENSLIPAGYLLCVATGGENSAFNPIGFREHVTPSLRGLLIKGGADSEYPLTNSFYVRGFGAGVRHRGAAAVLQVVTGTTYTPPTF